MPNVREIVEAYLEKNKYEGLISAYCCCRRGNLMPCEKTNISSCFAGSKLRRPSLQKGQEGELVVD